ncbi:MoaF-related domain-containing protein [Streptomyces albireticuli]|uniref:MoaF-related domain-containing protein n=1 Tax=Streptomyces albireticuli TaxID=1940 RepID=UPI001E58221E|nr:hypothetical protein [Streptomyces albireticuli]MCD9145652.1 hypothetical protein [Streptomyces albireticuli]MCD9165616.1 hypothetical protein [Streptomyces albireticuli]MCD9196329.1 hypothetical protein [Streptomyces albireticuli]
MKFSRLAYTAVPLVLAASVAGATAVEARPPSRPNECRDRGPGYTDATVPAVGQTWTADFGVDTPIGKGPFLTTITFRSATAATIKVIKGPGTLTGLTQQITYSTTRLRACQYAVAWHEPISGVYVTQVEDYARHRTFDTILNGTQFFHMTGKFYPGTPSASSASRTGSAKHKSAGGLRP